MTQRQHAGPKSNSHSWLNNTRTFCRRQDPGGHAEARSTKLLRRLAIVATLKAAVSAPAGGCTSAADCEYLGACNAGDGSCACLPGFRGASCSALDLLPTSAAASVLWPRSPLAPPTPAPSPTPPGAADFNTSAWGSDVLYDEATGSGTR